MIGTRAALTSNSVSVIDTRKNEVVANLLVEARPRGVAVSPDSRRLYVTSEIGGTVSTVDAGTHKIRHVLRLGDGEGKPVGVAVAPDGSRVFVTSGAAGTLSIISADGVGVLGTIKVGKRPWGVGVTPDGRRAVTANGASNDISIVDIAGRRVIATVPVGEGPWGVAIR